MRADVAASPSRKPDLVFQRMPDVLAVLDELRAGLDGLVVSPAGSRNIDVDDREQLVRVRRENDYGIGKEDCFVDAVNCRQLKQTGWEATHEPLLYVIAPRQRTHRVSAHAALACRSEPKSVYRSALQLLRGGLSATTAKTEFSNSPFDIHGGQRFQLERLNRTCGLCRTGKSSTQDRERRFPCRLKATVPTLRL
jgi:hypothetical protein